MRIFATNSDSPVKRFAGMNGTVHSSQQAASNQNHKHTLLSEYDHIMSMK